MAKDGQRDSTPGDGPGDTPEELDASASGERIEGDQGSLSDFNVPKLDRSEDDFVELGEPSHPAASSDSGEILLGVPEQPADSSAEGEMLLGAPTQLAGSSAEHEMLLGVPERPADSSAEGEMLLGTTREQVDEPVKPARGPTMAASSDKKKGFGRLTPTIAATLVAATVPSFLIYNGQQARVSDAVAAKKSADDQVVAVKQEAEVSAAKAGADQQIAVKKAEDAETERLAAVKKAEVVEAERLAAVKRAEDAEAEKVAAIKKAEEAENARLAAIKKAEEDLKREKLDAENKVELARKEFDEKLKARTSGAPGLLTTMPGPDPKEVEDATKLILNAGPNADQMTRGVRRIVSLTSQFDDPGLLDLIIGRLGPLLGTPASAQRLIDACVAAQKLDPDPKRARCYNSLRRELSKIISAKSASVGTSNGSRATGSQGHSARVHLVSARDGHPTSRPVRLVAQRTPPKPEDDLAARIAEADSDLAANPEDSSNWMIKRYIDKVQDCLELSRLLLSQGKSPQALQRYDQAVKAAQAVQQLLKKTDPISPPGPRAKIVLQLLVEFITLRERLSNLPDSPEIVTLRGNLDTATANLKIAKEDLTKSERALGKAREELEACKRDLGTPPDQRLQAAIAERDEARRKLREDAFLAYASGVDRFGEGGYVEADRHFSQAIKRYSRDPRFFYFRGIVRHLLVGSGSNVVKPQEAADDIREGVRLERSNQVACHEIDYVLHRLPNEVLQWVESIRHPAPPTPLVTYKEVGPSWNSSITSKAYCPSFPGQ
jgi:hypothetical protein